MNPETTEAGPARPGSATNAISAATKQQDRGKSTAPYVWATAYGPAGRRSLWLAIVVPCPSCMGAHLHRIGPAGGLRRSGCGRSSYYILPRAAVVGRRAA